MIVLVIDVGGRHVKVRASNRRLRVAIPSGPRMTAARMLAEVKVATAGWAYEAVAIGYPGVVKDGRIVAEPRNLGRGWVGFNFARALGRPIRITNDAAMQALGSYHGGRMLFLGLGTGLGTALVVNGELLPTELAHLPYRKGRSYEGYLGAAGLARLGKKKWRAHVNAVIDLFRTALEVDDVVLGGGNEKLVRTLPKGVRRGHNANAFLGGVRLWARPRSPASAGR